MRYISIFVCAIKICKHYRIPYETLHIIMVIFLNNAVLGKKIITFFKSKILFVGFADLVTNHSSNFCQKSKNKKLKI